MHSKIFKGTKSDVIFDIVNTVLLILITLIILYPLYYIVIASVSTPTMVLTGKVTLFPRGFQLESYKRVFSNPDIGRGYFNTILYTSLGTIINLIVTLPAAYSLSRKDLRGKNFIMMIFSFTMFFGGGTIPTFLVVKDLGLYNSFWALLIPSAMSVWNLIICRNFFEGSIPLELYEVSIIDGCTNRKFFIQIALPLSKALIAVMVLFYAVGHWNSYFSALLYLKDSELYPLQMVLRNILISSQPDATLAGMTDRAKFYQEVEMLKYALVIVSSVPVLMLYPFVQKYFVKGVMIGSIKG
ncbi:carbohydrate ABC transporter permease [Scatolibacter rhodanostii]|uniref:carbohydrate ABC transporter permease n=1 Tax=Scatolibacter rhodanostii TaxID=2014781 RepID=UPI000C076787|nr:carbohydrate ABC transporter permease [Scatolibacter rhodanostii]